MQGRTVDDYDAPLFLAWQLTNRCSARCLACCEESGPDKAWRDELSRDEALRLADAIVDLGIPFVAFGGGEPLGVAHCWDVFERLAAGGVALKLETDGSRIDAAAADRIADARGRLRADLRRRRHRRHAPARASRARASRRRPERSSAWWRAATRRSSSSCRPDSTLPEIVAAYDLAAALGCSAFVTGPLMRIGRAAAAWDTLGCSDDEWQRAVAALRERAAARRRSGAVDLSLGHRHRNGDAAREPAGDAPRRAQRQGQAPQRASVRACRPAPRLAARRLAAYRAAWRTPEVRDFVLRCRSEPALLRHANETWPLASNA